MKILTIMLMLLTSSYTRAEAPCDVRIGKSIGLKVVEFTTGHIIHSKMSLRDMTASALKEEMINLQDLGVCEEKIPSRKCILKIEKQAKITGLTLMRGNDKWLTWKPEAKKQAEDFIRNLKREGFCS